MRMVALILLSNGSRRALPQPGLMVLMMPSRHLWIFPVRSTISGMRLWEARNIQRFSSASACSAGW